MSAVRRSEPTPLYHQVYTHILKDIVPKLEDGSPLPTDDELAGSLGVSKGTVRLSFNRLEREGIVTRIAGRGTFLTEDYRMRLRHVRVGIVFPSSKESVQEILIDNWMLHMEVLNGLFEASGNLNATCSLVPEDSIVPASSEAFDGFIVYPSVRQFHVARIARPFIRLEYVMDHVSGFELIAAHAAALGFSRIGYIGFTCEGRIERVRETLARAGDQSIDQSDIVVCDGTMQDGYAACSELLGRRSDFDCIICSTDLRAIGVLSRLKDEGIPVPERISVYGFDGIPQAATTVPSLTTCSFDWRYPGKVAMSQIRAVLDGWHATTYIPLKGTIIERGSTRNRSSLG
jgi:DNA-binding LacI/PurR family transcriptional regulator/DNA-binding transcriptional regulator YhcF (GntR family)